MKLRILLLALLASLPFAIQAQKISQLPAAAALTGAEIVPMTQSAATVGATANQIANFIGAASNDLTILGNWNFAAVTGVPLIATGISGRLAISATQPVGLPNFTVSTLPTCNATLKGGLAYVTDATAPTYNATLTGGGAIIVPVFCNGTAWTSH